MKNEEPMTNEEKYKLWNEIMEASEKRRLRKLKRKRIIKTVMKIVLFAVLVVLAVPIALLYILGGSVMDEFIAGFHQLGEDHERFRQNKHFY